MICPDVDDDGNVHLKDVVDVVVNNDDDADDDVAEEEVTDSNPTRFIVVSPHSPHIPMVALPRLSGDTMHQPSHYLSSTNFLSLAKNNTQGTFLIEISPPTEKSK